MAKLKDGQQLYGKGWKIESPTAIKDAKDSPKLNQQRARRFAITDVNNTLNALKLYGKSILDKGDVDPKTFQSMERTAYNAFANKGEGFNKRFELVKFPNRDITLQEAKELGLWK